MPSSYYFITYFFYDGGGCDTENIKLKVNDNNFFFLIKQTNK